MFLTHVLFVDDVLLFSNRIWREAMTLQEILDMFYTTTNLELNIYKSIIFFNCSGDEDDQMLITISPFRSLVFWDGFKYLGFILK